MEYKYTNYSTGVEKTYEVTYDEELIRDLIDKIVKCACYKTSDSEVTGSYSSLEEFEEDKHLYRLSTESLSNGEPVQKLYVHYDEDDEPSIWSYKLVEPELATILHGILFHPGSSYSVISLMKFINYESSSEFTSIDERLKKGHSFIGMCIEKLTNGSLSDDEKETLSSLLYSFNEDIQSKIDGEYFNTELLRKFYEEAKSLIGIKLVNEKVLEKRN